MIMISCQSDLISLKCLMTFYCQPNTSNSVRFIKYCECDAFSVPDESIRLIFHIVCYEIFKILKTSCILKVLNSFQDSSTFKVFSSFLDFSRFLKLFKKIEFFKILKICAIFFSTFILKIFLDDIFYNLDKENV